MAVKQLSDESMQPEAETPEPAAGCAPLAASLLSAHDAERLSRQFSALADPVRLRLVSLLANAEGGAVCACDLVEPVRRSQPTVSHHLKVLVEAGILASERRGRNVWYAVVPAALEALRAALAVVDEPRPPSPDRRKPGSLEE